MVREHTACRRQKLIEGVWVRSPELGVPGGNGNIQYSFQLNPWTEEPSWAGPGFGVGHN